MVSILLFLTLFNITLLLRKIFLHYKLLRISNEGRLNPEEDYFLTYMFSNKHFHLKLRSNSLTIIKDYFSDETRINLKNNINKTLKVLYLSFIALLLAILIHQLI
jgi:hypothetical protein